MVEECTDARDKDKTGPGLELVAYRAGAAGFQDVANYDTLRYAGPANSYKRQMMANAYKRLLGPLQGKRVLDVGCGTGRGAEDFAREAEAVTGCDASLDMLSLARRKTAGSANCSFAASYAQYLPFPDDSFDVVTSLNFLHLFSLETQAAMVAEMKRVLQPSGVLLLEFDNALHGLGLGLYKRWFRDERGSLPWEIRSVLGRNCRVLGVRGAVIPVVWRLSHRFPRFFAAAEKLVYYPPFSVVAHRTYYKVALTGAADEPC